MICASGGSAPRFHTLSLLPTVSATSGASRNDRHSSPHACSCVQTNSSPGKPISTAPATISNCAAADAVAERAVADVGQRERLVALRERPVARAGVAPEVDDRDRPAMQGRCRDHRRHGRASSLRQQELRRIGHKNEGGLHGETHDDGTALLSFGALATSLLLAGCGSESKPAPAAAAATPPPAPPPPTLYDAEAFFATTSYIMPAGYAWSADDKQLLVSSDETGIYNLYALPAAGEGKQPLTSSTTDSTFAVSWFPADGRALFTADSGGNEINHLYVREADGKTRDLTPGDKVQSRVLRLVRRQAAFLRDDERAQRAGVRPVPLRREGLLAHAGVQERCGLADRRDFARRSLPRARQAAHQRRLRRLSASISPRRSTRRS